MAKPPQGSKPKATKKNERPGFVTVYHFKKWDGRTDQMIVPPRKSTAERIKDIQGAVIIEETARNVVRKGAKSPPKPAS
jgi:hypothetical protein